MNLVQRVAKLYDDLVLYKRFWGREDGERLIYDLVFDVIDEVRSHRGERPIVHLTSNKPFEAACGADDRGQATTALIINVTCPECRRKIAESSPRGIA